MSEIESKLRRLGLTLAEAATPLGSYVPAVTSNNLLFTSGQGPIVNGEVKYRGRVGRDLSVEEEYEAARLAALNCLAAPKTVISDLDRISRVVKITGFVNCAEGFTDQPKVLNGASDLLVALFGEKGRHVRSAIGVNVLPQKLRCRSRGRVCTEELVAF